MKKLSVPTKRATIILVKVKSCNVLLRMLLVCIRRYLKSVLRYTFSILDTYHPGTIYVSKDVRIRGYFSKPEGVRQQKSYGKHCCKAKRLLYVLSGLTFKNSTFCPQNMLMCFVRISEQTEIFPNTAINWLAFVTETESVYCAVRAEYLNVM
jgi:hypothetical protein